MPNYHHIFFTKAIALARSGRTDAAQETIDTGLGLAPTLTNDQYETGVLAYGLSIPLELRSVLATLWDKALA